MNRDDLKAWGTSAALHAVLLLTLAFTMAGPTPEAQRPPPLVEVDFGPLPNPTQSRAAPARETRRPAPERTERAATRPERPVAPERPEPRARPEATTPVNLPRQRPTPAARPEPAPPTPRRDPVQPPRPPAPATPRPSNDPPAGSPVPPAEDAPREQQAGGTPGGGTDPAATGTGSVGGGNVSGLGSRSANCPLPRFPGVIGQVTYAVTFAPDGRYVSHRVRSRGGDARLDQAARAVLPSCRAQALPSAADQVNQEGTVQFVFRWR